MFLVTTWPTALIKALWNLSLMARVNRRGGGHTLESSLSALEPELLRFNALFRPEPVRPWLPISARTIMLTSKFQLLPVPWTTRWLCVCFISTPFPIGYQQINDQNLSLKVPNCLALCFLFSLQCGKQRKNTTKDTQKMPSLLPPTLPLLLYFRCGHTLGCHHHPVNKAINHTHPRLQPDAGLFTKELDSQLWALKRRN